MIGNSGASLLTGAMICAPRTGCEFILIRSSRFSRSCFNKTLSGTPIFPTSCNKPPHSNASSSTVLHAHDLADVDCDLLYAEAVPSGIRIALVDGGSKRSDRLREHVAHLDEPR